MLLPIGDSMFTDAAGGDIVFTAAGDDEDEDADQEY